jgi:hypothetical protein
VGHVQLCPSHVAVRLLPHLDIREYQGHSVTTAINSGSLPQSDHAIRIECHVRTDDGHRFEYRLSDQSAIEGGFVMQRQGLDE